MSRVLVVDDDPDIRALVGAYLKAGGHGAEFAEDGEAGVAAATAQAFDLILTDVRMPRLDGFGLFNALRSNPGTAQVPVIMFTAHYSRELLIKALSAGVDDFIGKPVTGPELMQVV